MIGLGLLLAALQAADPLAHLAVRSADRVTSVPVVLISSRPMVRLAQLAPAIGGEVRTLDDGRVELRAGATAFEITPGVPFVRSGEQTIPLSIEPVERGDVVYVPYQFVSEILPRVAANFAFDVRSGELRVLAPPRPRARDTAVDPPVAKASPPARAAPAPAAARRPLVIVDAGHGGPDRGMTGPIGRGPKIYE
jgi:N-acetylmuramoyl-L-alanine amidase